MLLNGEGAEEMLQMQIHCPKCKIQVNMSYGLHSITSSNYFMIRGILKCNDCGHERPLTLDGESIREISDGLPDQQSDTLNSGIAEDIKEDIREAERALYNQCYKASVTMCRRALQLSLIDRGIEDKWLSKMILKAKDMFSEKTFAMANSIKGFGDMAAHRRESIESEDAKIAIYMTVKMLNELAQHGSEP